LESNIEEDLLKTYKTRERIFNNRVLTIAHAPASARQFIEDVREQQWKIVATSTMLPIGLHCALQRPVEYITVLRDPLERCVSALNFVYSRNTSHPYAELYRKHNYSIKSLIDSGEILFFNDQVRILSGSNRISVGNEELYIAKGNLKNLFSVFGTVHMFSTFCRELEQKYRWKTDPTHIANKGSYSSDLDMSQDDIDFVKTTNELDYKLYDWVCDEIENS
jgi:hypothetical protein